MRKVLIFSCLWVLSCGVFGQQIKKKNVELEDLINLLDASGYELFSFDITDMLNEQYNIVYIKTEYKAGKEVAASNLNTVPNKRLLTDFSESSYQQEFIDGGGRIIDPKIQAVYHAEKISFGFYPASNDSTKFLKINVPNIGSMSVPLKLKGLVTKNADKLFYSYNTRPFKIKPFKEDEFIPLILFGSSWYDERFDVYRFCGENEIEPDMSSEILKDVPHYYVVGIKFVKKQ